MKINVVLPEHIGDITLEQYQAFTKLEQREDLDKFNFEKRKLAIFTNLKHNQVKNIQYKDYADILTQIDEALKLTPKFEERFTINGLEFGFIPNLDKMQTKEFVDLEKWGLDTENLHRVMAVLFRPVVSEDKFNNYKIADYYGTEEHHNAMKQTPLHIVNGAIDFFYRLSNELSSHILKYMQEEVAREKPLQYFSRRGDGTLQYQR